MSYCLHPMELSPIKEQSSSEPSSTISVPEALPSLDLPKEDKEVGEEHRHGANTHKPIPFHLDLQLRSRATLDPSYLCSNTELNLLDSLNTADTPNKPDDDDDDHDGSEQRVFSCNYCHRKFYSSQALGGHQNAHKRERTLAKRGRCFPHIVSTSLSSFGHIYPHHSSYNLHHHHQYNSFPSLASLPLHGSYGRSSSTSLGLQAHSSVTPPSAKAINYYGVGNTHTLNGGWPNTAGASSSSHDPLLRVGVGTFNLERTLVGSPVSAAAAAARDQGIGDCWKLATGGGGDDRAADQFKGNRDDPVVKKLDLSLRL